MAFPSVGDRNGGTNGGTPRTINLPANITSGDLLIVYVGCGADGDTLSFPSGWTIFQQVSGTESYAWAYRQADGNESSTIEVTGGSGRSAHRTWRITGHEDPSTQAPEASGNTDGSSTNPDSGSITPTGGSKDYLFLAVFSVDVNTSISSAPTNYTNPNSNSQFLFTSGSAERQNNTDVEDPGAFTIADSGHWRANVTAIHPASGGGGGATTVSAADTSVFGTRSTVNVISDSQILSESANDTSVFSDDVGFSIELGLKDGNSVFGDASAVEVIAESDAQSTAVFTDRAQFSTTILTAASAGDTALFSASASAVVQASMSAGVVAKFTDTATQNTVFGAGTILTESGDATTLFTDAASQNFILRGPLQWQDDTESDRAKGHWTPYEDVTDNYGGVDFVPEISRSAPFSIRSDRPVVLNNTSTITASGYTAERRP